MKIKIFRTPSTQRSSCSKSSRGPMIVATSVKYIYFITNCFISIINSTSLLLPRFWWRLHASLPPRYFESALQKKWKGVKLIHGGNFSDESISSFLNSYLTSSLNICVQVRGTGPILNVFRNRPFATASPRVSEGSYNNNSIYNWTNFQ